MKPPKIVLDTNIYLSAIIYGGNPRVCLDMARDGEVELFVSRAIILEVSRKLNEKFEWSQEEVEDAIKGVLEISEVVKPREEIDLIKSDEDDNRLLEVAKDIGADFIISGDKKHILPLKKFGKTYIVSAADFVKLRSKVVN